MTPLIRRLIHNTLSNFGVRLIEMILTLVSVPVLIKYVGEPGFDLLILVGALTGYFGLLGAGVPTGATKFVAEYHAKEAWSEVEGVINTSLMFFVVVGVVVAALIVVGVGLGVEAAFFEVGQLAQARHVLWMTALIALFAWPASAFEAALGGLQEHHARNKVLGATRIASQLLAIGAAVGGLPLIGVYAAREAPTVVRLLLLVRLTRGQVPGYAPGMRGVSREMLGRVMGLSVGALLGQVAGLLIYQTDKVILKAFFPGQSVLTVYTVIAKPYELVRTFSGMFNSAVMPTVSALEAKEGMDGVRAFAYRGARASNAFVGILAVGAAYLGVPFIRLWVGEQYVAAAWITPLLCIFQLIWQSNAILGPIYNASGRALKLSLIALGSAAANVALSLWLVRGHGVQGVLLATMIAGALTVPVQYLLIFPVLGLERRRYLLGSVVRGQAPSLLVGALLWPLSATLMGISSWWALLAAGGALGAALLAATWAIGLDSEQRGWLSARVRGKLGALRR